MQLQEINKSVYRQQLNKVIVGFIGLFALLAISLGQTLIYFFGVELTSAAIEQGQSNFRYNLMGVILALFACAAVLHHIREKQFFNEIYYVWQLKQLHNLIYRKLKKIKAAADKGEQNAVTILLFYYTSLKQVYMLDDNTLTMSSVEKDLAKINELIEQYELTVSAEQFDKSLLLTYK